MPAPMPSETLMTTRSWMPSLSPNHTSERTRAFATRIRTCADRKRRSSLCLRRQGLLGEFCVQPRRPAINRRSREGPPRCVRGSAAPGTKWGYVRYASDREDVLIPGTRLAHDCRSTRSRGDRRGRRDHQRVVSVRAKDCRVVGSRKLEKGDSNISRSSVSTQFHFTQLRFKFARRVQMA